MFNKEIHKEPSLVCSSFPSLEKVMHGTFDKIT